MEPNEYMHDAICMERNVQGHHTTHLDIKECITYIAGGFLGDFIHQMSVIKEKYILTGKKGILYISDRDVHFRLGVETTYQHTYQLVMQQDYIHDYKIYAGEHYDINLTSWRIKQPLYTNNWAVVFGNEYGVEWGKHQWLCVPKDTKWADKILINETTIRFSNIDYKSLYETYGDRLIFIGFTQTNYHDYEAFVQKTGLQIEYYDPITIYDITVAIYSCDRFIGAASAPMAIAFALKVPVLLGRMNDGGEYRMFCDFPDYLNNIVLNV